MSIKKHLEPGMKVIEIGAGTGRYSHTLARQGYTVDAVGLIEHNIEIFRSNTLPDEHITITSGNAVDLSGFTDDTYDITLLLGPMYHLFTKEEKQKALAEALRITKRGGIIYVAYCIADISILDHGFKQGHIFELIEKEMLDTEQFKAHSNPWDLFELHRREDMTGLTHHALDILKKN